jgi:hypothetical protein
MALRQGRNRTDLGPITWQFLQAAGLRSGLTQGLWGLTAHPVAELRCQGTAEPSLGTQAHAVGKDHCGDGIRLATEASVPMNEAQARARLDGLRA